MIIYAPFINPGGKSIMMEKNKLQYNNNSKDTDMNKTSKKNKPGSLIRTELSVIYKFFNNLFEKNGKLYIKWENKK